MSPTLLRPKISELVFELHGRPLHPELFEVLAERRYDRAEDTLRVWITRNGHVLTWQNDEVLLTEMTDVQQELRPSRRLLHFAVRGEHSATVPCGRDVIYRTSFQVEKLPPEIFVHMHDDIVADSIKRGFLFHFQPHHRLSIAPVGFVIVDARPHYLHVSTFHTFPDENAIVRTQTLIEKRTAQDTQAPRQR